MFCKKCKKQIPESSVYCLHCGKKQESTPKKRTHKRAHGSGTVHKDNRYSRPYIALAPADYAGKRRYIGSYSTYSEAQAALDSYSRNGKPELINATFRDIYDMWSETHYKQISENSAKNYETYWKRFAPLYRVKISDLRTPDFQAIVDASTSRAAATLIRAIAKMICDYALENDIVAKNYADFVKLPKLEKAEKQIFTAAQIAELWQHTDDYRIQVILVMIYMGFRIGEINALTVDNVHFSEGYIIAGEKTDAGKNRVIPFPPNIPEIAGFVRKWVENATPNGKLFDMNSVKFRNKLFYAPLVELGMISATLNTDSQAYIFANKQHLTPHSTRHTFASLSAAAGVRPDDLQKIIGHADYSTTANVYVHKDIEHLISEMSKLSR